ncbi:MAG: PaaI family thioesterase [Elioraea sp.]|nr:PaaI family thioesterase [Elioraea sp.]
MSAEAPALDRAAMEAFLVREFPGAGFAEGRLVLEELARGRCRVAMPFNPATVRPGPSVSGPAIMALGDISAWIALLSVIGPVPLAVTSNLNVSFLRPAGLVDLACACRVLRAGRRLATMLADVVRVPDQVQVAHLTVTYAIPDGVAA